MPNHGILGCPCFWTNIFNVHQTMTIQRMSTKGCASHRCLKNTLIEIESDPAFALASAFAFAPAFACVSAQYLINHPWSSPGQVLHLVSYVVSALVRRVAYAPPWLQITMQINILQILSLNSHFLSSLATGSVASFAPTQTSRTSCSFLTAQHRVSHMSAPPSLPFGWHGTQISPWRIKSVVGAAPYFSLGF